MTFRSKPRRAAGGLSGDRDRRWAIILENETQPANETKRPGPGLGAGRLLWRTKPNPQTKKPNPQGKWRWAIIMEEETQPTNQETRPANEVAAPLHHRPECAGNFSTSGRNLDAKCHKKIGAARVGICGFKKNRHIFRHTICGVLLDLVHPLPFGSILVPPFGAIPVPPFWCNSCPPLLGQFLTPLLVQFLSPLLVISSNLFCAKFHVKNIGKRRSKSLQNRCQKPSP